MHGDRAGFWAVTVTRNWRIVFRFDEDGDACDIDFVDYHSVEACVRVGATLYVRQHPGTVIRELWLDGEQPAVAARRIGVPLEELMALLDGRAALSPRLATKLEAAGWSNAPFWLRLQHAYDRAHRESRQCGAQAVVTVPNN